MDVDARRGLLRIFDAMPDPRAANARHLLSDIIAITLMATFARCDDWEEIEDWGEFQLEWLKTFLPLPHGIPSADTFQRVFRRLNPDALERCLCAYVNGIAEATEGRLVAIDGKSIRRSLERGGIKAAVHMVSAWCDDEELILGQIATNAKSNEITAIPQIIEMVDINNAVVTIDAMGCQHEIAEKIVAAGGDYLLAVKDNQPNLHESIKFYFDEAIAEGWGNLPHQFVHDVTSDHGRLENRRCWTTHEVDWLRDQGIDWPHLHGIVCVECDRLEFGKAKGSVERRYFITSADPRRWGPRGSLDYVRRHWGIENKLHWSLDMTFREDHSRVRKDHEAENLSRIRRLVLNVLQQLPVPDTKRQKKRRMSKKNKRLYCQMSRDYLLQAMVGR